MYSILNDDCLNAMSAYADKHFHACVTDPPYGLNFMGKNWDHGVPNKIYWQEVYRVLRPGGYILAFGGSRTYHRLAVAIEDAGFEIRDTIMWVYGSGFPKGLNIGKATGLKQWEGWNTNLKPAHEPIIMARKPLDGSVVENVMKHGTGGINIDECRVGDIGGTITMPSPNKTPRISTNFEVGNGGVKSIEGGRYPANLIHDGSEEVLKQFPEAGGGYGVSGSFKDTNLAQQGHEYKLQETGQVVGYGDSGSAARFFYCAKASPKDRNEGCEDMEPKEGAKQFNEGMEGKVRSDGSVIKPAIKHGNSHPTVKPTSLMQYLCKLVTPKDGIILDPFCGSGSTGKAAILEGFNFVGIEKEADYAAIASKRCEHAQNSHLNK